MWLMLIYLECGKFFLKLQDAFFAWGLRKTGFLPAVSLQDCLEAQSACSVGMVSYTRMSCSYSQTLFSARNKNKNKEAKNKRCFGICQTELAIPYLKVK